LTISEVFSASGNAEIVTAWGVFIDPETKYEKMDPKIESFLINTGRRKFLSPLYMELVKTEEGKKTSERLFTKKHGRIIILWLQNTF
jgi:leukotriene-A4 hydrolase